VHSIHQYVINLSVTCSRSVVFFRSTPVSSTNKTYSYDITAILLKLALNTTIPLVFVKEKRPKRLSSWIIFLSFNYMILCFIHKINRYNLKDEIKI